MNARVAATYRVIDEPAPSGLAKWAVRPLWPLFAVMFAGMWLALPWFALNAVALGSSTRKRELWVAALAVPGLLLLMVGIGVLYGALELPRGALSYLMQATIVAKLALGYSLFILQERSSALHEYYGGQLRNGLFVVLAGALVGRRLVESWLEGSTFLNLLKIAVG